MATYDFDFQRYVDRNNARQGVAVDGERPEFGDYAFSGGFVRSCSRRFRG